MKTWPADFPPPVTALFFGDVNVSVTIPECAENRRLCMTHMNDLTLATPYQDHTNICVVIDAKPDKPPVADAYVTKTPDLAIGVLTADCAPVLFHGNGVVGAAHAGARGALRGIIASTVKSMRDLGAKDITAAIGPAIAQESYEVGPEFYDEFVEADPDTKPFFKESGEKYLFDVAGYVGHLLDKEGISYARVDVDTYKDPHCFSYRRATHRGEKEYGRQLAAIAISSARR